MFWKNNKVVLLITSLFLLIQLVLIIGFDSPRKKEDNILPKEIVLTKGMKICAETENDSICISAIDENKRSIFWGREHIIITLVPRQQRWHPKSTANFLRGIPWLDFLLFLKKFPAACVAFGITGVRATIRTEF